MSEENCQDLFTLLSDSPLTEERWYQQHILSLLSSRNMSEAIMGSFSKELRDPFEFRYTQRRHGRNSSKYELTAEKGLVRTNTLHSTTELFAQRALFASIDLGKLKTAIVGYGSTSIDDALIMLSCQSMVQFGLGIIDNRTFEPTGEYAKVHEYILSPSICTALAQKGLLQKPSPQLQLLLSYTQGKVKLEEDHFVSSPCFFIEGIGTPTGARL